MTSDQLGAVVLLGHVRVVGMTQKGHFGAPVAAAFPLWVAVVVLDKSFLIAAIPVGVHK